MTNEPAFPDRLSTPPSDTIGGEGRFSIGELTPDEWTVLRDLKLKSLEQEPIAFEDPKEGKEKYLQRSQAEWRDILAGKRSGGKEGETITVFAKDGLGGNYVGMVSAITTPSEDPDSATVQHMYVDSDGYRGKGLGKQLLQGLIERIKARGDIKKLVLQVVVTQEAAIGLYKSVGFHIDREIEHAATRDGVSYNEYEMHLDLGDKHELTNDIIAL